MKEEGDLLGDIFEEHQQPNVTAEVKITLEVPATSEIEKLRGFAQRTFGEGLSTFKTEQIAYTRTHRLDDLVSTIAIARAESEELYCEFQDLRKTLPEDLQDGSRTSELEDLVRIAEELVGNLEAAESNAAEISETRDRMRQT